MLNVVANLLEYKVAGRIESLEKSVRDRLHALYKYPHETHSILESIALHTGVEGNKPYEIKAQLGHVFIKKIVALIDEIYANHDYISLSELRESLLMLMKMIQENEHLPFSEDGSIDQDGKVNVDLPFEHVSYFIAATSPAGNTNERKKRGAKVRMGLSRIFGLSKQIFEDLGEIEALAPEKFKNSSDRIDIDQDLPEIGTPRRGQLNKSEIMWFVRNHGPEYGINEPDDLTKVLNIKPYLLEPITSLINSLRRGGGLNENIKREIDNVLGPYSDE